MSKEHLNQELLTQGILNNFEDNSRVYIEELEQLNINYNEPWIHYKDIFPEKTVPQLIQILMAHELYLCREDNIRTELKYLCGLESDCDGFVFNVNAKTLPDALKGLCVLYYYQSPSENILIGAACTEQEQLKKFQQKFLKEFEGI